jgi:DnaK suppressor protein
MMNDNLDLQEIRQKLQEQRAALLEHIKDEETRLHAPIGTNPDQLDLAQDYRSKERGLAMLAQSKRQLEQIEAALQRLDEDTYGKCAQCGQPIALARLKVLLYATLCIKCQEQQEMSM